MIQRGEQAPASEQRLARLLSAQAGGLAVAFSGGVDSSVLLHAAVAALGERAVGVLADSPSLPRSELREAHAVAAAIGARLVVVATEELEDPRYRANAGDRCYFCKHALFTAMRVVCDSLGFATMAFGEIVDDWGDDRPGARAAKELKVIAPLSASGFSKQDVRDYAARYGLAVASKPASACLASRLPVGTTVTRERLGRVEAAEERLRELGLRVLRVRDHGELARVEVGTDEHAFALEQRPRIDGLLADLGFLRVDLKIYLSPSERV